MANYVPKVLRRVRIFLESLQSRYNLALAKNVCTVGNGVRLLQGATIYNYHGTSYDVTIGNNSVVMGEIYAYCVGSKINIGEASYIGPGSKIMSFLRIEIGSRVQISYNVTIVDSNCHSTSAGLRFKHAQKILNEGHPSIIEDIECKPVYIEDDVWIGFGSSILKGVRIGRGAIIGSCSVITHDVAPMTIVAGNPQRVIGISKE